MINRKDNNGLMFLEWKNNISTFGLINRISEIINCILLPVKIQITPISRNKRINGYERML